VQQGVARADIHSCVRLQLITITITIIITITITITIINFMTIITVKTYVCSTE
jgi:hypothetical protein